MLNKLFNKNKWWKMEQKLIIKEKQIRKGEK